MGTVIVADTEAVVVDDKHNEVVEPDIVVVDGRADSSVELLWAAAIDEQSIAPQQPFAGSETVCKLLHLLLPWWWYGSNHEL